MTEMAGAYINDRVTFSLVVAVKLILGNVGRSHILDRLVRLRNDGWKPSRPSFKIDFNFEPDSKC